jgi:toxin secretion/phage lysis holin
MGVSTIKAVFAAVGVFLTSILGGWDTLLYVLVIAMVLDYISGVIAAAYNKELSSKVGFRGILKKLMMVILVALAVCLDAILQMGEPWIRTVLISWFIINEAISILENAATGGLLVPAFLKDLLLQYREKIEGGRQ